MFLQLLKYQGQIEAVVEYEMALIQENKQA
jgi:hypothetical protein